MSPSHPTPAQNSSRSLGACLLFELLRSTDLFGRKAWKRLKAATKNGSPGSWQSPMLFEQAFNHSLQGMMHIPIEDLMLFANKLCWRCGDKDPVKVNNNLLTATSSFYDASLLAASGVAIMKLADKWAGRKGYTSDTAVAALLRQFCTDVGHPLPPLRALPEPGQRDQECGLLANGMRGWCALRNAFEILHNALVPWTDNSETMWDTGIRSSAADLLRGIHLNSWTVET